LATESARLVTPSDIAPIFCPRPVMPSWRARSVRCSATPSLVTGPASVTGRIAGRIAATQGSAATASIRLAGTVADSSPVVGSVAPGTAAKSAELPVTVPPSAVSCAASALPTGPSACTTRSNAPSGCTPSTPSDRLVTAAVDSRPLRATAALAAAARCCNSQGTLLGTAAALAGAALAAVAAESETRDAASTPIVATARDLLRTRSSRGDEASRSQTATPPAGGWCRCGEANR
jgi:hypothetical protein